MKAIFKREFRALLLCIRGMVFLGLFLLAAGILIAVFQLNAGIGNMEVSFSYLLPVLVLLLPLISADAFVLDRKTGTERFLRMQPIPPWQVVLGKYLARVCFLGIPFLVLALYPIIMDLHGEVDYAVAYGTLGFLFLIAAILIAAGGLISAKAKNMVRVIVAVFLFFFLWYASGVVCAALPSAPWVSLIGFLILCVLAGVLFVYVTNSWCLGGGIALVLATISVAVYVAARERLVGALEVFLIESSPFRALDDFVFGLADFRSVLFCLAWIAGLLGLQIWVYYRQREEERRPWQTKCRLPWTPLLLSVGMALTTWGVSSLPSQYSRMDLTKDHAYTISAETKQYFASLDRDVTLYLIDADKSDYRFELFLSRVAECSDRLHLEYVNTWENPTFLAEHGLSEENTEVNSLLIVGKDREQYVAYTSLFSFTNEALGLSNMSYSQYLQYSEIFSSHEQYYEYWLALQTGTVQTFEGETVLPMLVEYMAADMVPTVYLASNGEGRLQGSLVEYLLASYGVRYRPLTLSAEDVPADAAAIVVSARKNDLTEDEVDSLRRYLQRGGQVTVLSSAADAETPNLHGLLAEYQLQLDKKVLICEETNEEEESKETTSLKLTVNFQHDILAPYAEESDFSVVVTDANAILYPESTQGSLIITPLLSTDDKTYPQGNPEQKESYAVAVAAETADRGRVVWFTAADSFLGEENTTIEKQHVNNAETVLLAVSWTELTYHSQAPRGESSPYTVILLSMGETASLLWGIFFVLLVPVFTVLPCWLVYDKRRK